MDLLLPDGIKQLQVPITTDAAKSDCVLTKNYNGKPTLFERWKDNKLVAWAIISVYPVGKCPDCGKSKFRKSAVPGTLLCVHCNSHHQGTHILKRCADLIYILSLDKGKGYANDLLDTIKTLVDILVTSYSGSTEEGRKLCLKAGMVQKDDKLKWEKPHE